MPVSVHQALRIEPDHPGDLVGQQFAVDAGRNALEQRTRELGELGATVDGARVDLRDQVAEKIFGQRQGLLQPRLERFATFFADQRIRIVAVGQEQEADLAALADLAQRILQRAPRSRASRAIAVEAEDQLVADRKMRCR